MGWEWIEFIVSRGQIFPETTSLPPSVSIRVHVSFTPPIPRFPVPFSPYPYFVKFFSPSGAIYLTGEDSSVTTSPLPTETYAKTIAHY